MNGQEPTCSVASSHEGTDEGKGRVRCRSISPEAINLQWPKLEPKNLSSLRPHATFACDREPSHQFSVKCLPGMHCISIADCNKGS